MKEIIVTGGEGFIGGHLVQRLLDEGYFVKVIDDERVGKYKIHHADVLYINEDVANYKLVERDKKVCAIFHLANSPRVRRSLDYPVDTMRNNVDSTLNVVQMALDIKCPLFFSTSSSTKYVESTNPYTLSKKMCEDIIVLFKEQYGLNAVLMYYYNVFGPGEADYGPYSTVIRRFKQRYLKSEPLAIFGDGSKRRAFTHVYDVVESMMCMMKDTELVSEVHFGHRDNVSILEVARAFNHPYIHEDNVPGEAQETVCDKPYIRCAREVLEYVKAWVRENPKNIDCHAELDALADWMREEENR